jgi:hypothetical protein
VSDPLPHDEAWWADWSRRTAAAPGPDGHDPPAGASAAQLARAASLVQAELTRIAERFAAASSAAWRATVAEDTGQRDAAEGERQEAAGEFFAAGLALADLLLLLLRQAAEHRAPALCLHLLKLLAGDPDALRALGRLIREAGGGGA